MHIGSQPLLPTGAIGQLESTNKALTAIRTSTVTGEE